MSIKHKKQLKNLTTDAPVFMWALAESLHTTKRCRRNSVMLRA